MTFAEAMMKVEAMIAELDQRIARVIENIKKHDKEMLARAVARAKRNQG